MKNRSAIMTAALAFAVAGCGDVMDGLTDAGNQSFSVSSGTYAVTDAVAQGTDQCGLLGAYTDPTKKIAILVNGETVTFDLANDPSSPANSLPTATLNGNELEVLAEANYTFAFVNTTCVVRIKRSVTGELLADDTSALTLTFSVQTESGTCNGENSAFAAVPCSSTYRFNATRE
jgi:hypothetical protein